MPRVLIFSELYTPNISGGAEKSTQLLAESLAKMGNSVTVCCTSDEDKKAEINGVDVIYLKIRNVYWPFKNRDASIHQKAIWHLLDSDNVFYKGAIERVIKEIKPDIIHTNNICGFSCIIWDISHKLNIPVVHTLRDYYLMCTKCTMYNGKECLEQCSLCKILSYPKLKMSSKVNAVVGISEFILAKHLKAGYFPNAIMSSVISNPIGDIDLCLRKDKTYRIGYIGSISSSKGVDLLVNVFCGLNNDKYRLSIAGRGDEIFIESLKKISDPSKVEFVGFVNSAEFFKSIDLLVVPSQWNEPFGRVVIEAIASGTPVIASNMGGIPEILRGRSEGVIFKNSEHLKELLQQFVDGKLNFNFDNINAFCEKYSAMSIAKRYSNLYQNLI